MTPEQILLNGAKLMKAKQKDYVNGDTHQNFNRSTSVICWFKDDIDKVYVTLITTKMARLAVLLSSGNEPENESIRDSFVDLVNYCALWGSRRG